VPVNGQLVTDDLTFVAGPAMISILATRFPVPVSSPTERHLLSLIYSRAKAHQL
jgi:hypothetical protein